MIDVEEEMVKAQKLKPCDVCKQETEPAGGVAVREKWHCAKCWVKFMQRKGLK